jgi:hypothetical protein
MPLSTHAAPACSIIYHAGPTNSGKTYNALQAMRAAKSGVYCGPLRLLAMEVYDTCNAEGLYCNLITGEATEWEQGWDGRLRCCSTVWCCWGGAAVAALRAGGLLLGERRRAFGCETIAITAYPWLTHGCS